MNNPDPRKVAIMWAWSDYPLWMCMRLSGYSNETIDKAFAGLIGEDSDWYIFAQREPLLAEEISVEFGIFRSFMQKKIDLENISEEEIRTAIRIRRKSGSGEIQ